MKRNLNMLCEGNALKVSRQCGMTIIELMIVISIVGILACISSGSLRAQLIRQGLNNAVEQLRGDMQKAKLLAVKQRADCSITINSPAANQYTISLSNEVVDLGTFRGDVIFTGPSTPPGTVVITFTPWGTCTAAGQFQLTSQSNDSIFRLSTSIAGGISKRVKSGATWVATGT